MDNEEQLDRFAQNQFRHLTKENWRSVYQEGDGGCQSTSESQRRRIAWVMDTHSPPNIHCRGNHSDRWGLYAGDEDCLL